MTVIIIMIMLQRKQTSFEMVAAKTNTLKKNAIIVITAWISNSYSIAKIIDPVYDLVVFIRIVITELKTVISFETFRSQQYPLQIIGCRIFFFSLLLYPWYTMKLFLFSHHLRVCTIVQYIVHRAKSFSIILHKIFQTDNLQNFQTCVIIGTKNFQIQSNKNNNI